MKELKATPGPWIADIRGGCLAVYPAARENEFPGISCADDRNVHYSTKGAAYNGMHWDMCNTARANACLIAAAPELYEALRDMITSYEVLGSPLPMSRECEVALDALAKARGEI